MTSEPITIRPPFEAIAAHSAAARFLSAAIQTDRATQAYLFTGPPGSQMTEAALLLAQALLCSQGGGDDCDDCRRVVRLTHPDLHILGPEGAGRYLSAQMTDLIHDVTLAPVRSARKVYILGQADRMSSGFANALLKVLEEPPESVVFILQARNAQSLLATVRSRCQIVPFAPLPEDLNIKLLADELQVSEREARLAYAWSASSVAQARQFLLSQSQSELRRTLMACLRKITVFDSLDVMEAARELVIASKLPLDDLTVSHTRQLEEGRDTLSKSAQTALEQRLKREMTAAERETTRTLISGMRSWLRDILLAVNGQSQQIANYDEQEFICALAESLIGDASARPADRFAGSSNPPSPPAPSAYARLLNCLQAADQADTNLDYNVSVQSILEFLLFTLRDELRPVAG